MPIAAGSASGSAPSSVNASGGGQRVLAMVADEEIRVSGHHGVVRVRVPLGNPGDERLTVPAAELRGAAADVLDARAHRRDLVLFPRQSRWFTLAFQANRYAAPGEYRGELLVGDDAQPIVVEVPESVDLRVSPSPVLVPNLPGETVRKQLSLRNEGNVPLSVAEIGPVVLDDELLACRAIRRASKVLYGRPVSVEQIAVELLQQAGGVTVEVGFLRVRNPEVTVEPGHGVVLELEIRVPDKIDPRGRYTAITPLYTTDISFLVVPGPAGPREVPEPQGSPATKEPGPAGTASPRTRRRPPPSLPS